MVDIKNDSEVTKKFFKELGITTLSNGKKVVNFNSPNPLIFEDGTVVPKANAEQVKRLEVLVVEELDEKTGDVTLSECLHQDIWDEMETWEYYASMDAVDIVFIQDDMYRALKELDYEFDISIFRRPKYNNKKLASTTMQYV